jgi:hypothetical protein
MSATSTTPRPNATPPMSFGSLVAALTTLTTPRMMQLGLGALAASLILFWIVGANVIADAKQGVQTIGRDTAPSVVAAQQIRAHLSNMDANVANAALTRGETQTQAWKDYAAEQASLSDHLVSAAQNITFGDAERKPIIAIATGAQRYADLIGQAHAIMATGDQRQNTIPDAALALIRQADAMLTAALLPAAEALNDANETVLNDIWNSRKAAFVKENIGFVLAGLPALIILVVLQLFVTSRTRRLVNPGLLAATILMAGAIIWAEFAAGSAATALTSAKQDAFDSIRAMWKTRAIAYSANADESYFLLDSAHKQAYAAAFQKKMLELADKEFLAKPSRQQFLGAVSAFERRGCVNDGRAPFHGQLGAELLNVTFEGECGAAAGTYKALAVYLDIDSKIRDLEAAGQRDAAVALNVGVRPDQSNYAFDLFDKALGRVLEINQGAFNTSIAEADSRLAPLPWIVGVGGVLVALLALAGLRPRLNEYRS